MAGARGRTTPSLARARAPEVDAPVRTRSFAPWLLSTALAACSGYDRSWLEAPATPADAAPADDAAPDQPQAPDVAPGDDVAPSPDVPPADDVPGAPDAPADLPASPDARDAGAPDVAPPPDVPPPPPDVPPPPPDVMDVPAVDVAPDVPVMDLPRPDVAPDLPVVDVAPDRPAGLCGDGLCIPILETCTSCPADCGRCPSDPCASSTSCDTCTPRSGCGWCRRTNTCATGTSTGSNDRACAGTDWLWEPRQCPAPDPCARYTSCRSCAATNPCGWCQTSTGTRCASGSSSGPSSGSCTRWTWRVESCGG